MTEWLLLGLALILVATNAVFVAAEFSLITVDRATVEQASERGDRSASGILAALRTLSTQMSGAQLGITVTSLVVGFISEPSLAALLDGPLERIGLPTATATGIAVLLALLLATMFQMIFGELVPKNLAIARPLAVARVVSPLQRGFTAGTRPLINFLNGSANRLLRAMGIEPQEELRSARSAQELESLVRRSAEQGTLPETTAGLLGRSLAFGERTATDVMTPRVRMRSLAVDQPVEAVLDAAESTGHSRFPVLGAGGVDDVAGLVHIKHALAVPTEERGDTTIGAVMVEPVLVPASAHLDLLLARLREWGLQMAVVVDEYGGTDGLLTLEDLIEELVGDIADEHDRPGAHARRRRDGAWSLSGLLRLDEVTAETGVRLPEDDDFDTLAGLLLDRLGRLPQAGETVLERTDGTTVELTVERMDGRRVDRIRLTVRDQAGTDPATGTDADPAAGADLPAQRDSVEGRAR